MGEPRRLAFSADGSRQVAASAMRAAWWGATALTLRAVAKPGAPARPIPADKTEAEPLPKGFFRKAWWEAIEKDNADVAAGLYPPMRDGPVDPLAAVRVAADLLVDAREVEARRRRRGGVEARDESPSDTLPAYYRQNFHYQSGGWFTEDSARRYEAQVETLFAGAAGPMRRRALALLARHWRGRDHRDLRVLDLACGSGAFLENLAATFPRARLAGVDLSTSYLAETRRASKVTALAQANAERLPFADGALDAVTCIYLFHELPPRVRPRVAAEIARVLKPGGVLAFADSIQPVDEPRLERMLINFPAYFHEPFYGTYSETDLPALFGSAGLTVIDADKAFLTKAILFEKPA